MLKKTLVFGLIILFMGLISVIYVSSTAKSYTKDTVLTDLKSNQWRIYGEEPRTIRINEASLPNKWKAWLVKIQDPDFYNHHGVDLTTPGAGLTTITQSMVKKLYFENFKPGYRKLTQTLIAYFVVDDMLTKSEQLTVFLNASYMGSVKGELVFGFENAARTYFGKPFVKLTDDQFLSLVAMLIGTKQFSLTKHPEKNRERVQRIKKALSGEYVPRDLNDLYYNKK